jgi:hypothetical protein
MLGRQGRAKIFTRLAILSDRVASTKGAPLHGKVRPCMPSTALM